MASIFTTGTINQPDAGSVGLAMVERIRDDVTAHAAWDLVEEFTPSGGTCRWYVFKCLATESGLPSDFYWIISRTLGSGELRAFHCEQYDSSAHIARAYGPPSYFQSYTFDATGRYTAQDYLLGTQPPGNVNPYPFYHYWTPSGTSTKWWIITAEDEVIVAFNGASNGFFDVGAYIPLTQMPIDMPVQQAGYSDGFGRITNNPAVANLTALGSALTYWGGSGQNLNSGNVPLGFMGDLRYNDKLQGGQRPVSEMGMVLQIYQGGDEAIQGKALGKQKRMRFTLGQVQAGLAFGDAYVLENRLWVPYNPTDGRLWDTGVAAS